MEENKTVAVEATAADEYSKSAVPMTARKSFMSALIISLGYVFVVTSMQAGASIGVGLSFNNMVWAVLVSSAILTVLSCIMGVIACKSGLSFGLMARYSFGQIGTWVPVVIVAITTIGWFSIDAFLIGDSAHRLFSWMPTMLICILAGLGMTLTAAKGTKWMNMLSNFAVPIVLIFGFISIIRAFGDVGGVAGINALVKEDSLTFAQAVSLGVGSYAVGSVMFTPDIMRFAKNSKTAIIVMIITITLGNSGAYADDHLAPLKMQHETGITFTDTMFQGSAPSLVALMGNHIDSVVCNVADVVQKSKDGQVVVLATMGAERNPLFPDAPTLKELGYDVLMGNYTTLAAPAGTPDDVLATLRTALENVCKSEAYLKAAGEDAGLPIVYFNAEEIEAIYKDANEALKQLWKDLALPSA